MPVRRPSSNGHGRGFLTHAYRIVSTDDPVPVQSPDEPAPPPRSESRGVFAAAERPHHGHGAALLFLVEDADQRLRRGPHALDAHGGRGRIGGATAETAQHAARTFFLGVARN